MTSQEKLKEGKTERVNVRFPRELMNELRRYVPIRQRSQVIIAGTARVLAEMKRRESLKAGAGAWSDESHPELVTQEDVNYYLWKLRTSSKDSRYERLSP